MVYLFSINILATSLILNFQNNLVAQIADQGVYGIKGIQYLFLSQPELLLQDMCEILPILEGLRLFYALRWPANQIQTQNIDVVFHELIQIDIGT